MAGTLILEPEIPGKGRNVLIRVLVKHIILIPKERRLRVAAQKKGHVKFPQLLAKRPAAVPCYKAKPAGSLVVVDPLYKVEAMFQVGACEHGIQGDSRQDRAGPVPRQIGAVYKTGKRLMAGPEHQLCVGERHLGERSVFPRRYGSEQLKVHFPVPDLWAAADSGSCLQDSLDLVKAGQPGQKLLADVLPNKIQVLFPIFFQHRYQIIF